MTSVIERRVAAAQATLDHFKGRPFVWGTCDCASLAAFVRRRLGLPSPRRRFGTYRTALGAKRALLRKGFTDLADVLDHIGLKRIPLAYALPGDIIGLPGEHGEGVALTVALGNGRVLGFREQHGVTGAIAGVLQPSITLTAWQSI